MSLTDAITNLETENARFRNELESANRTNALLQDQVDNLTADLASCRKENLRKDEIHQMEIDHMVYQRDSALRRADEVRNLIVSMGKMALEGVQKMKDDEASRPDLKAPFQPPERIDERTTAIVGLPPVEFK